MTTASPVGSLFPLNLNQTPVSGTGTVTSGGSSTGAFFSTVPEAEFQGAHNLVQDTFQAGGAGLLIASALALGFAFMMRR